MYQMHIPQAPTTMIKRFDNCQYKCVFLLQIFQINCHNSFLFPVLPLGKTQSVIGSSRHKSISRTPWVEWMLQN
uniref:Uncharacterized protein n=1 Tax=Anguilla anguilla TaxID=7936 RepID=A0A0E9W9Q2_ANGAN